MLDRFHKRDLKCVMYIPPRLVVPSILRTRIGCWFHGFGYCTKRLLKLGNPLHDFLLRCSAPNDFLEKINLLNRLCKCKFALESIVGVYGCFCDYFFLQVWSAILWEVIVERCCLILVSKVKF